MINNNEIFKYIIWGKSYSGSGRPESILALPEGEEPQDEAFTVRCEYSAVSYRKAEEWAWNNLTEVAEDGLVYWK